jgi:hypothetical protein
LVDNYTFRKRLNAANPASAAPISPTVAGFGTDASICISGIVVLLLEFGSLDHTAPVQNACDSVETPVPVAFAADCQSAKKPAWLSTRTIQYCVLGCKVTDEGVNVSTAAVAGGVTVPRVAIKAFGLPLLLL